MNKDQRKYLIDQVHITLDSQTKELRSKIPTKPSLNNYLIAAFLDNSIEFADIEELRKKVRERVIKMGKDDVLVKEDTDMWGRRKNEANTVKLVAEELFVIPKAYLDALKEYEETKSALEEEIKTLTAQAKTIEMKIQIGSPESLKTLVTEIDNLVDLKLVNSKFLLNNG